MNPPPALAVGARVVADPVRLPFAFYYQVRTHHDGVFGKDNNQFNDDQRLLRCNGQLITLRKHPENAWIPEDSFAADDLGMQLADPKVRKQDF